MYFPSTEGMIDKASDLTLGKRERQNGVKFKIDRFEKTMADVSEEKKKNFYTDNFKRLLAGNI